MSQVSLEKIEFVQKHLRHPDCVRLNNGVVDIVATTQCGPRILRYGFIKGENMLGDASDVKAQTPLGEWRALGGHRLWAAPEAFPRSYSADNFPLEVKPLSLLSARFKASADPAGIEKEIEITLEPAGSAVTLRHTLTNRTHWRIEVAPWALTIVRGLGRTILPLEPFQSHGECLDPARPLVLWHFTQLDDPRFTLGKKYITMRSVENMNVATKIGTGNKQGWAAYHIGKTLFVKRMPYNDGQRYPDYGCNTETFTKGAFMEVESLGHLEFLNPGESAHHTERWYLFDNIDLESGDDAMDAVLKPLVAKTALGS